MFTEDILIALFETVLDDDAFAAWAAQYNYASMTDQEIYAALPDDLLPWLGEFGLNASWMHRPVPTV